MRSSNIIIAVIVIVVLVILGYFLFFRGNQTDTYQYAPNPTTQQTNPADNQSLPPVVNSGGSEAQPAVPTDQTLGGNSNVNANTNANPGNANTNQNATTVTIKNFAFTPANLTVKAGSTVQWTNMDTTDHTVTSDNNLFNSGTLSNSDSYQFKFDTPGTYTYHCSIHPMMKGTITVQ